MFMKDTNIIKVKAEERIPPRNSHDLRGATKAVAVKQANIPKVPRRAVVRMLCNISFVLIQNSKRIQTHNNLLERNLGSMIKTS